MDFSKLNLLANRNRKAEKKLNNTLQIIRGSFLSCDWVRQERRLPPELRILSVSIGKNHIHFSNRIFKFKQYFCLL